MAKATGADLFEIKPKVPYSSADLNWMDKKSRSSVEMSDPSSRPEIAEKIPHLADYDTVFLGFPSWGETAPPVIRSFLSGHDLSGKTLIPFVTHGGYGLGKSRDVLVSHAPKARLLEGFVMEMDQERRTMERVTSWLGGLPRT